MVRRCEDPDRLRLHPWGIEHARELDRPMCKLPGAGEVAERHEVHGQPSRHLLRPAVIA